MAQIKVTVADDDGEIIGIHDYDLAKGLDTLSKMEGAIEELRPQMLSDINKDLLAEEQKVFQKNETCGTRKLRRQNQDDKRKF